MSTRFVVEVDGQYLGTDGEGGIDWFDSINDSVTHASYEEARDTAEIWLTGGWRIIEV
ncbi:MAG: hypothetical protein ACAH12_09700 [Methylophilaceae bacterium]